MSSGGALVLRAIVGLFKLLGIMALVLFLCAGSLDYWEAWTFLVLFFLPALLITLYLLEKDPDLLERRIKAGPLAEKEKSQRWIQILASLCFLSLLVVPGLDRRFHWSTLGLMSVTSGDLFVVLGLFIVFLVFRENTFTSAVIEVSPDQKVISTGPYSLVRHPMYAGALILLLGMPLALGSGWGLVIFPLFLAVMGWRIRNEEKVLIERLPGYAEYCQSVRYRLLPGVW